jgi:carboxymethylenebutenolidase
VCERLARRGYAAVAPDLYHGEVATTPEEAAALRSRRRAVPMWREIVASLEHCREASGAPSVGLVGFSMGGHWALWLASQARPEVPEVAATVVFSATRACDFRASRSAFQVHLAETDPFVSGAGVARLRRSLTAAAREAEFWSYPGTGHWFFDPDTPQSYHPSAARLALRRTEEFLDRHLSP